VCKLGLRSTGENSEIYMTVRVFFRLWSPSFIRSGIDICTPPPLTNSATYEDHAYNFEGSDVSSSPERLRVYSGVTIRVSARVTGDVLFRFHENQTCTDVVLKPVKLALKFPYARSLAHSLTHSLTLTHTQGLDFVSLSFSFFLFSVCL
jgi:hypothetical protein